MTVALACRYMAVVTKLRNDLVILFAHIRVICMYGGQRFAGPANAPSNFVTVSFSRSGCPKVCDIEPLVQKRYLKDTGYCESTAKIITATIAAPAGDKCLPIFELLKSLFWLTC